MAPGFPDASKAGTPDRPIWRDATPRRLSPRPRIAGHQRHELSQCNVMLRHEKHGKDCADGDADIGHVEKTSRDH